MTFTDRILDWRFIRMAATLILIFIYYQVIRGWGVLPSIWCSLILLLDIVLLWARETWWSRLKYILITSFIIILALSLLYVFGMNTYKILWPLIWIFANMYGEYNRLSIVLATFTITVILLMAYAFPFPFETLVALVGLFLGIRSRKIRQDAFYTNQMHLKELNEAHKELQQAHLQLQEASVYSMRYAALEERTRLAREIHDGIGHQLTSLIIQLQALEIMLPDNPEEASKLVSQLLPISRRAMAEVRLAVREWSDDEMGLGLIALKGLISQTEARSALRINLVEDSEVTEWPIGTSIALYRILQESLTNILRHSNAKSVTVYIREKEDKILLGVSDDGQYTGEIPLIPGFGLKGIMERCQKQGGSCSISAENPHGLRIDVTLPIEPETSDIK